MAYEDVKLHVQSCVECQYYDHTPRKEKILRPFLVMEIFGRWALDYVVGLSGLPAEAEVGLVLGSRLGMAHAWHLPR